MRDQLKRYVRNFSVGCSNTVESGNPSNCDECLEEFVNAVDRLYNKPSPDLSVPKENPGREYILYEPGHGWFVGFWWTKKEGFYWTTHDLEGDERLNPTYWLPLPNNP